MKDVITKVSSTESMIKKNSVRDFCKTSLSLNSDKLNLIHETHIFKLINNTKPSFWEG